MKKKKETRAKTNGNAKMGVMLLILVLIIVAIVVVFINGNKKEQNQAKQNETNKPKENYVQEMEDGIKINKSTPLNTSKEVSGFMISNIQLTTKDGMTTLLADVTNNTGTKTPLKTVEITLLDNQNQELVKVTGVINELETGKTAQLNISMTSDYVNAYDFKAEIK